MTRRRVLAAAVSGLLVAALVSACAPSDRRPNVVILLLDTLRADRLGCYGYGRDTSPHVDHLAAHGVLFRRAYATADYTSASTASLHTGRDALAHGYVNADHVLEADNLTLAEILAAQGYRTAGFTANGLAGEKYQMNQGFEQFFERNRAPAPELVRQIETVVDADDERPFFVYAHFMDVHDPYRLPRDRWDRFADPAQFAYDMADTLLYDRFIMAAWWHTVQKWEDPATTPAAIERYFADYGQLYDAAIAYWDDAIGGLLTRLTETERPTIVVVTSDHGEQLLEHGYFGHANSGYDVGLHIPLVIHDPDLTGARSVLQPVSIADVLPTLLTRLGIEVPADIEGRERWSLVRRTGSAAGDSGGAPQDESDAAPEAPSVYTAGTFMSNRPFDTLIQTYRRGRWKLLLDRFRDTKALYDLDADPGERHDQFAQRPDVVASLAADLRARHEHDLQAFGARRRSALEREAEKLRELRALGYLGGQRRRLAGRGEEFLPMQPVTLTAFGPFGDEPGLQTFGDALDFTTDAVPWAQVLRGYSDALHGADGTGRWFDRRATFLLRNREGHGHVVYDVTIEADPEGRWPSSLAAEFDDRVTQTWHITQLGAQRLVATIPASLADAETFHCGLRANHRFVLRRGDTPRLDVYGALKIRAVGLAD